MAGQEHFYTDLPRTDGELADVLTDERGFEAVPEDWAIVMADVSGSTQAVAAGLHHEVNLAATGSVVAVGNVLRDIDKRLRVPFFFGGDGATFLIPPLALDDVLQALERYQIHVARSMGLTLKVGAHSVAGAYAEGHTLRLARVGINALLSLPVVLGTGIKYAERIIKAALDEESEEAIEVKVNLEGMECRWDEIQPPLAAQRVYCLVAVCLDDQRQGAVYGEVLRALDGTFGRHEIRQPITRAKLKLDFAMGKIRREMRARLGQHEWYDALRQWIITLIGPLYFKFSEEGRAYLGRVIDMSHTLMIDGSLNFIVTGTASQCAAIEAYLTKAEARGDLVYGSYTARAAIMSCYVVDRQTDHAHFVDGTEGGFTNAARVLKEKLGLH